MIKPKILISCLAALCVSGTAAAAIIVGNQKDSKKPSDGDGFSGTESIENGFSNTETDGYGTDTTNATASGEGDDALGDTTPDDGETSGAGTDSPSASPDSTSDPATDSTQDSVPDSEDDTTSDSPSDSLSDSNDGENISSGGGLEGSGAESGSGNNQDPTPDVHEHRALDWEVKQGAKPTLLAAGQAAGECACGETLFVVLPALGPNDYQVTAGNCLNLATYRIYVDAVGGLSTFASADATELIFQDPNEVGSHIVEVDGAIYTMNQDMYPMNGVNSYKDAIKELVHTAATCVQPGKGYFECSVCEERILVNTYRGHEYACTLTKVSETEFALAWTCAEGGEEGSQVLSLKTEENPSGEVEYDGEYYTVSYDGEVYVFSAEEVE